MVMCIHAKQTLQYVRVRKFSMSFAAASISRDGKRNKTINANSETFGEFLRAVVSPVTFSQPKK